MNVHRGIFQVIWPYLTPLSQQRLRRTCRNFREWSKEWSPNLPNLNDLLNPDNWFEWLVEQSGGVKEIPEACASDSPSANIAGKTFRWSNGCVFLEIDFIILKSPKYFPLLQGIRLSYDILKGIGLGYKIPGEIPAQNFSFVSMKPERVIIKDSGGGGENYGSHPRSLPEGRDKTIFYSLRQTLVTWKGSSKIRKQLYPYCSHCFGRQLFPEKLTWVILRNYQRSPVFACDQCIRWNIL